MKIDWREIVMEDRKILEPYYEYEQSKCCEISFANNFLWAPFYDMEYAIVKDMLIFITRVDGYAICFPLAKDDISAGNLKEVIEIMEEYFRENNQDFKIRLVTEEKFAKLEEIFPERFEVNYNRDIADYVYETEKMISLAGKKLHGKRNHINKFKENNPNWSYEPLSVENREECLAMAEVWREINLCGDRGDKHNEFCVTRRAVAEFDSLGLTGGVLRDGERIVAFTLGEVLNDEMFVVHIEKAFAEVQGAYPMINQQFLMHEAAEYRYVNREEDTGAEGLRKAKLSYYPVFLQEKGEVTLKGTEV